jgi:hypothetical protein
VDGILYRVHRYFFCRDSKVFMTRISRLLAQDASSLPVISIENVESNDFDAFLSIFYPLCVICIRISCNCVIDFSFFAQGFQLIGGTLVRRVIIHLGLIYSMGFHQYPRISHPPFETSDAPPTTNLGAKMWRRSVDPPSSTRVV